MNMKQFFRPTLVRRVMSALLIAFALMWLLLLVVQFFSASSPERHERELRGFSDDLVTTLEAFDNQAEAAAVAAASEAQVNRMHTRAKTPRLVLIQLHDLNGNLLYGPQEAHKAVLTGEMGGITQAEYAGQTLRVYHTQGKRWSVLVGSTQLPRLWILGRLAAELTFYMLIAFPFVLVPLLAVSQGLRPLREISEEIDARSADDLSPTGLTPRYLELKPLIHSLDSLLSQLRSKVKRESAFVHEAAHELRTPMAVVSAQAHALVHAPTPVERREAEARLDHAIARASHLVEQLLQLAKVDSDWSQPAQSVDLTQELQQALAMLAPAAMEKNLELSLDAPDSVVHVLDLNAFRSILHNLVGNAILYVPAGGQVEVTLAVDSNRLVMAVADDGPGIPEEHWPLVFERFFRGSGHDEPGSGLGLAIVKQASAKLGGLAWVEKGLKGRGCKFVVSLPRRPVR